MGMIYTDQVIMMVRRALNLVDRRLIDHGAHVAVVMKDMLETKGIYDRELKKNLCILALFHDVGAYRLHEIDQLVRVETENIWEHSINGYLFLKEFGPFGDLAKVILYHHADENEMREEPKKILKYAQWMRVADRVEIWHRNNKGENKEKLKEYLKRKSGTLFLEDAVEVFLEAEEIFSTYEKLKQPVKFEEIVDCSSISGDEADIYLWMLVHAIDFRSRFTVTHTASVMEIAWQLAKRLGMSEKEQEQIYYGAMLHDLGKIGTPTEILEKPGRLTDEEMEVMKEHINLSKEIIEGCVDETVMNIALRHHEKIDGSGYPLGLSGDELTLSQRIMTVADIVSALCMSRSYKEPFPKERVLGILSDMKEKGQIDGQILSVMEKEYDDIIEQAEKACDPVREVHRRMGEEYQTLLNRLS